MALSYMIIERLSVDERRKEKLCLYSSEESIVSKALYFQGISWLWGLMTDHVRVLLHGTFREIAGVRETIEEIASGSTTRDVLSKLAEKYGKDFNNIINPETGQIGLETLVMVNGKSIRRPDLKLRDNDVVMITVPVGGG